MNRDDDRERWSPRWALAGLVFARLVSQLLPAAEGARGQWATTLLLLAVNAGFVGVVLHRLLRGRRLGGERVALALFAAALLARVVVLSIASADGVGAMFWGYVAAKKWAGPAEGAAWIALVLWPLLRRRVRGHPLGVAALGLVGFGLGWSVIGAPSALLPVRGDWWVHAGRELAVVGWLLLGFEWRSRSPLEPSRWLEGSAAALTVAVVLAGPIAALSPVRPEAVTWTAATLSFALWAVALSRGTRDRWAPTLGAAIGCAMLAGGAAYRLLVHRAGLEAWGFDAHADAAAAAVVILTSACAAAAVTTHTTRPARPAAVFGVGAVAAVVLLWGGGLEAAKVAAIAFALAAVGVWWWRETSTSARR